MSPNSTTVGRITTWLEAAIKCVDAAHGPDLTPLLEALDGSTFFIQAAVATGEDGRARIAFSTYAPKGAELKQRMMLPAHAAITRVIELAGGQVKTHQPHTGDNYQRRLRMDHIGTTNLTRILFDAGRSRDLQEVRGGNYHDITPANFVLRIGSDRSDVLAVIRQRDPKLADLLTGLFALADRWHGAELKHTR